MTHVDVRIYEVGPRDGLQNEAQPIPTGTKLRFIELLAEAGLREIEATSFVAPGAIPQLADADDLLPRVERRPGVRYPVLVPNARGLERAIAAGADAVCVFTAASESFTRHNIGMSIAESLDAFRPVIDHARRAGWWSAPLPGKELSINGVYRLTPDGTLSLLVDDFALPNGLAFSPDESVLYIDDSAHKHIRAFDVRADGTLTNSRILLDMASDDPGVPDGFKVDGQGNVFCTGPGGVWVCRPTGELLGRILPPELPANLAWGEDGSVLFLTARTSVYRLPTTTRGALLG